MPRAKVRVSGDGVAVEGACILHTVVFTANNQGNTCNIYDGVGVAQGKPFHFFNPNSVATAIYSFGAGVEFASGIYVNASVVDDVTTIVFTPLNE